MTAASRLREVARQLALELRKVMGDPDDVEMPQNRLLGLAIEQELERRLDATFRRVSACHQSLASVSRHRQMMARLVASDTHDDLEFEWIAFAGSLDLDHPAPFRHVRTGPRQFDISYSPAPAGGIKCNRSN